MHPTRDVDTAPTSKATAHTKNAPHKEVGPSSWKHLHRQICVPHPSVPPRCPDFDLSGEKLEKDSDERQTLGTDLDSLPLKNTDVRRFGASMSALSHLPLTQRKGDSDSVPSEATSVVS